jgi:hypothetical protein
MSVGFRFWLGEPVGVFFFFAPRLVEATSGFDELGFVDGANSIRPARRKLGASPLSITVSGSDNFWNNASSW